MQIFLQLQLSTERQELWNWVNIKADFTDYLVDTGLLLKQK